MQRGFSLVELGIVLVILGLLVGGILAGQSLVRAAELRSVVSDIQRFGTAVQTFRIQYRQLPGDMHNATDLWGIAGGTTGRDTACYNVASTGGTATCNGNDNGRLQLSDNVGDESAPEWFRAWQHLANAGLVEGKYTGKANGAPRVATPGKNVPQSKIRDAGFTLMSYDGTSSDTDWWEGQHDGLFFGTESGVVETCGPALKPEEAWNIDTKLDDGRPASGLVRDVKSFTDCHNGTNPDTALYSVRNGTVSCSLFFAFHDPADR